MTKKLSPGILLLVLAGAVYGAMVTPQATVTPQAKVTPQADALEQARNSFHRADYPAAIALLRQSASDAHSLELLGRSYFMQGEFRRASETLEQAAQLEPSDSRIQTWLGRAYGRRAETAFALNAVGLANKSREALEKAVQLNPANKDAFNDLFEFYVEAPGVVGGGVEKARALLPQILKYDPVGFELAQALLERHDRHFDRAEAHLRKAIGMEPQAPDLHIDLAKFLAARGRFEESEAAFACAETLAHASNRVAFARAETWIQTKRNLDQARDVLRRYLSTKNLTSNDPPRVEAARLLRKVDGV